MTPEHKAKLAAGRLRAAMAKKTIAIPAQTAGKPRKALTAAAEARMAQMPVSYRAEYRRAMLGGSRRAGIHCQCRECMGWENVVAAIQGCTAPACSLYPYRPYQEARV